MKNAVFDSTALLAYLFDGPGAETVAEYFKLALQDKKRIFICSVNWCEVMDRTLRAKGKPAWKTARSHLCDLPMEVEDTDLALSEAAAEFKAAHNISLAGAYAVALTKSKKAELVTGDPEFRSLEKTLTKITWLA
jgi:predicted nucleic acid-binding protein